MSAAEKANIITILTEVQSSAPEGRVSDYAKCWQFCPYQQWCHETHSADVCRLSSRVETLIVIIKITLQAWDVCHPMLGVCRASLSSAKRACHRCVFVRVSTLTLDWVLNLQTA